MYIAPYPYLEHLLGAYFHQDCYDEGATNAQLVEDFKQSTHGYEVLGLRADILRFLHLHRGDLKTAIEKAFSPDVSLGETDEGVEAWLISIERQLRS
jgi:hypothetical protein